MPIYEYHCEECGKDFEYLVLGKSDPECSACNRKKVNRLMSACGFISKGSGGETVSSCNRGCGERNRAGHYRTHRIAVATP